MSWPSPEHSRSAVNRAGATLASRPPDFDALLIAHDVLSNWRACHGYPINTFQSTLRLKLNKLTDNYLVAQRLKRTPSIVAKLRRFPKMNLARMQDIGGLRAVVNTISVAKELRDAYINSSRFSHKLVADIDYIATPKESGYRGFHLVYRYRGRITGDYDGLRVELQIRTRIQHAWATAVEVAGTFLNQSLKSSEGSREWLQFFALASAGLATMEDCFVGDAYSRFSVGELRSKTKDEERRLRVSDTLGAFGSAVSAISQNHVRGSYYLIVLDLEVRRVHITTYRKSRLEEASQAYTLREKEIAEGAASQAVLVSASSIDQLRRAYPNYFLDTAEFLQILQAFTSGHTARFNA